MPGSIPFAESTVFECRSLSWSRIVVLLWSFLLAVAVPRVVAAQTQQAPVVVVDSSSLTSWLAPDLCLTVALAPETASECSNLRVTHALPATRTLSKARAPVLIHNSFHAHPIPNLAANVTLPASALVPDSVVARLWVCPLSGSCTFRNSGRWSGSNWVAGAIRRISLGHTAKNDSSGVYRDSLEITNWYGSTPKTTVAAGEHAVVNRHRSYFGAGWWVAGLEQLRVAQMVWVGGDGSLRRYVTAGTDVWVAPGVTEPDTLKKVGTEYIRYLPGKIQVVFNASGQHIRTVNALGHTTTFAYTSGKLTSITLAPSGAGKVYTFAYPSSTQITITAPPIGGTSRVTTITLVSGFPSTLTQIRDPDNSTVNFTYTNFVFLAGRTDRRGNPSTFTYDPGWRIASGTLNQTGADAVTQFTNAGQRGYDGGAAADTSMVFTKIDGPRTDVGDTTRVWLTRFGAPRMIRNALGYTTVLRRADTRWPALVTQAIYPNGRNVAAVYDTRGHLVTSRDSSNYDASRSLYATTTYQWDMACDAVTKVTQPESDYVDMAYDASCNRTWQQPGGNTARRVNFYYDATWSLLRATLYPTPVGDPVARDSIAYDAVTGNIIGTKTPKNYWTSFFTDAIGRDTLAASAIDSSDHSAGTGTNKHRQRTTYDVANRATFNATAARNSAGSGTDSITVRTFYNAEGLVDSLWRRADPDADNVGWVKTKWLYDSAGRKVVEVAANNFSDTTGYDVASNVTRFVSRRRYVTTMTYDVLNRLTQRNIPWYVHPITLDANNDSIPRFPKGFFGIGIMPGDTQAFAYDTIGNMITANNRDAQIERTYAKNGTLATETQRMRSWADISSGGSWNYHVYTLEHTYNLNGRRIAIKHPGASISPLQSADRKTLYTYSATTGELTQVRDMLGRTYGFTYTPAGQLATLSYPGGLVETNRYDADGNLRRRIEVNKPGYALPYDYMVDTLRNDSLGWRDARGKLLKMTGQGFQPEEARFTYNGLGNIVTGYTMRQFLASELGQPISMYTERAHETYASSPLGNMLSSSLYDTTFKYAGTDWFRTNSTFQYEAGTGRLLSESGLGYSTTQTYDSSGNVKTVQRVQSGVGVFDTRYYYGADEKLRIVDNRRGGFGIYPGVWHYDEYRYDALGRRVLVRSRNSCRYAAFVADDSTSDCRSKIRRTIWDGAQELWDIQYPDDGVNLEKDLDPITPDGRLWGRVVYAHAEGIDRPLGALRLEYRYPFSSGSIVFDTLSVTPHYNWRGVPDWASFPDGRGDGTGTYTSGGTTWVIPMTANWPGNFSSFGQRYYFQNMSWYGSLLEQKREATGLLYRRNRYYDAGSGRFTQEDPIGLAGGLNLYGYANGDPIQYSDPFGLNPCKGSASVAFLVCMAVEVLQSVGEKQGWKGVPASMPRPEVLGTPGEGMTRVKGGMRYVSGYQNTGYMSSPNPARGVAEQSVSRLSGPGALGRMMGGVGGILGGIIVESIQAGQTQSATICRVETCDPRLTPRMGEVPSLEPSN